MAVHGEYYRALGTACLIIGRDLDGAVGARGFQDAITPPSSTNARLANWTVTLIAIAAAWYAVDLTSAVVFLVFRLLASRILFLALHSEPPKPHFCRVIYRSMCKREADYIKSGDLMRAAAMGDLRIRFEDSNFIQQIAP